MYKQFDSDKKKLFDYNNFTQDDIWDRPNALNKMLGERQTTNHHHSIFSNPPNRIAIGDEVYFDEIHNKVYRGNMNGTWTEATELEPVIIKHLFATIINQDGLNIWALGGDAVAGSGNIKNDRGRGSISHPRHTYNGLFDLSYLLGKLFPNPSMMYPWLLEFQLRLKYGTPKPQSSDTKATVSSDPEMHIMALYNYGATDAFGRNPSQLHENKIKDTTVEVSQKAAINRINEENRKKAEKERDAKNRKLQQQLDYYKQ
ncbi:hypothetical protein OIU80_07650 [Flavobacterium sp. LS1R47]|uniref:Uncharacterized protein n=1 Tax=Flavobacterium frigoritolerans TaxID=2987686 RepID=A0A9X2ZQR3_9FLAO|nr:hypothetical protein [Flavobacterium frigoritolerans]MCV9932153.1 hypothetical protein [Flavobacterium frigoritolerans]